MLSIRIIENFFIQSFNFIAKVFYKIQTCLKPNYWSAHNPCLLWYEAHIQNVTYHPFLSRFNLWFSLFLFIFSRFILFCITRILINKNSVQNQSLFYFQTTAINLALQLLPYFFFAVINHSFSELPDCGNVCYVFKKTKKFRERNSINTLFLKFKVERSSHYCKISILKITVTSALGLPHKTILFK